MLGDPLPCLPSTLLTPESMGTMKHECPEGGLTQRKPCQCITSAKSKTTRESFLFHSPQGLQKNTCFKSETQTVWAVVSTQADLSLRLSHEERQPSGQRRLPYLYTWLSFYCLAPHLNCSLLWSAYETPVNSPAPTRIHLS